MANLRLTPTAPSETDIKHQIRDYLNARNIFNFYCLQGMGAYKGIPDRIFIYKGVVVFLEIKKKKGTQSEHQKAFQADIERGGGRYLLVRTLDEVIAEVGRINYELR